MRISKHWAVARVAVCVIALGFGGSVAARAQESSGGQGNPAPRSEDGKPLFDTTAALRVARVTSPRISPDDTRVAYLVSAPEMKKDQPWKMLTQLWVAPTTGPASAARQYTRGEKNVGNIAWSSDGKILAFTMATDPGDQPQVWFLYADGGEAWQVTRHKGGVRSFAFSPDRKTLLLAAAVPTTGTEDQRKKEHDDAMVIDRHLRLAQLWTWDIASGQEKQLTHTDSTATDPRWSPDGTHVTFTAVPSTRVMNPATTAVWVVDFASGQSRKLADTPEHTHTARWSPDGRWIAYLGSNGGPGPAQTGLYIVAAQGGQPRKLGDGFALNVGQPAWSSDGKTIFFSTDSRESMEIFAADVASGNITPVTREPAAIALSEISADGRTAVGTWSDPEHPADVFRFDLSSHSIEKITNQNAWLANYALGTTEVIRWKNSKDGMEIDGIVTKPVAFDPSRKYPMLLNPHGGPTGASLLSFNPQEQIFAANGYLVLQPNFRGSTGRGLRFAAANENDWGGADFQDDMSGVDALIARGWVDPSRLGAVGWSYGGYMTLWMDTQTDRFKAISPGAGLSDLFSMYSETDSHRYLASFFGDKSPWDNFDEYWAHSPMKFVDNVKTPTLILGGQADTRVPIPQAEEFYRALFERHVPVEFVMYPRENHGFVEPRHIQDRWQRYLVFFGKYLANPPVTENPEVVARMRADLPEAAGVVVASDPSGQGAGKQPPRK